jgi:capsular exopolysaccharide synthesis family protein
MKQELIEAKARLEEIKPHYGRAHPEYRATLGKIHEIEKYLSDYQNSIKQKLAEVQRDDLGPMLLDMLHQKLALTRSQEAAQAMRWQEVYREATRLQSRLDYIKTLSSDTEVLRTQREGLVQQIGNVKLKHDGADMRAKVVAHPTRVDQPVSPNLRRVALMAVIAGLAMGLLAVYVLDILDDRFRSAEEMQAQLRAPVLSMVRQLKAANHTGLQSLQVYSQPDAPESEAFRTLRTALSLGDQPAYRMVITSAEPGDGKTTVLANLAVSYAQSDKRTLLIDADLRRPGLTATLGLKGTEGLSNIIRSNADVAAMATSHIQASGVEGLDVLSSGPRPSNPGELLSSPRFADLLGWAETLYDRILIDSPPALAASDTAIIGRLVDGAMLVVQPEKNRRRLVIRAAESLTLLKINVLGVVINRVCSEKDGGYYGYDSGYHYDYGYGTEPDTHEEQAGLSESYVDEARSKSDAIQVFAQNEADREANIVPRRRIA